MKKEIADLSEGLESCVIMSASSQIPIKELVEKIKMMGGKEPVQLFDPAAVISSKHILAAYVNARLAFNERRNIAKTLGMEMLLFLSMQRKIDEALRIAGAKSEKDFVLFCGNARLYDRVSRYIIRSKRFRKDAAESKKSARMLGLESTDQGEIMERMAESRMLE